MPEKILTASNSNGDCKGPLEVVSFNPQEENRVRKHRKYNKTPANNWGGKKDNTIERGIDGQL